VLASTNLLGEHQPQDMKLALSYLARSRKMTLLLNELGHLPQSFKREQGWFYGVGIDEGSARVIRQAGGNCSVIAIGQADDEVGISSSAETYELYALAVQRVVRMGHCYPFLRWFGKGGSVQ
jgi:hypothetical protein